MLCCIYCIFEEVMQGSFHRSFIEFGLVVSEMLFKAKQDIGHFVVAVVFDKLRPLYF